MDTKASGRKKLGLTKLSSINVAAGVDVPIFVDAASFRFSADLDGSSFHADSVDDLKEILKKAFVMGPRPSWERKIVVQSRGGHERLSRHPLTGPDFSTPMIMYSVKRFFVGTFADGRQIEHPWQEAEPAYPVSDMALSMQVRPYLPPHADKSRYGHGEVNKIYDYSDSLWAGLYAMAGRILDLHSQMESLLLTPEGIARVESAGQAALASPKAPALPGPRM